MSSTTAPPLDLPRFLLDADGLNKNDCRIILALAEAPEITRVGDLVWETHGINRQDVARVLGLAANTIDSRMRPMRDKGIITVVPGTGRGEGNRVRYRVDLSSLA